MTTIGNHVLLFVQGVLLQAVQGKHHLLPRPPMARVEDYFRAVLDVRWAFVVEAQSAGWVAGLVANMVIIKTRVHERDLTSQLADEGRWEPLRIPHLKDE